MEPIFIAAAAAVDSEGAQAALTAAAAAVETAEAAQEAIPVRRMGLRRQVLAAAAEEGSTETGDLLTEARIPEGDLLQRTAAAAPGQMQPLRPVKAALQPLPAAERREPDLASTMVLAAAAEEPEVREARAAREQVRAAAAADRIIQPEAQAALWAAAAAAEVLQMEEHLADLAQGAAAQEAAQEGFPFLAAGAAELAQAQAAAAAPDWAARSILTILQR